MALFPSLEPDTRAYDYGDFAMMSTSRFNSGDVRFNYGSEAVAHELELPFLLRNAADLALIRDHYRGQNGRHRSFRLPPIAWRGHATDSDVVPIDGRWRYAGPPEEGHGRGGLHAVVVRLQYVGEAETA